MISENNILNVKNVKVLKFEFNKDKLNTAVVTLTLGVSVIYYVA